jgi:hypothetical protein
LSDRRLIYVEGAKTVIRLAIQLGREDAGRYRGLGQVAGDAEAICKAGADAKRALSAGQSPAPAYARAVRVAQIYDAQIVRFGEDGDTVLGLRFWGGRFGKPGAVFRVS